MVRRHDPGHGPDELDADLITDPEEPGETSAPVAAEITSELDLHTFLPRDCASVVDDYVHAAQAAGLSSVRIVHGKGTGTLQRIVHAVLDRHPAVHGYRLADERGGGWGATLVELRPGRADT